MANWLHFDRLKKWDYLMLPFFQYDKISDKDITEALLDIENLLQVDSDVDWEDDRWLSNNKKIPEKKKHAYRVAALIRDFQSGKPMENSIFLDTFNVGRCGCCIDNGHHRVRALQYLGVPGGPFALSGYLDPLEELVSLAGMEPPKEFAKYFVEKFFQPQEDDVVISEEYGME